MLHVSFYSASVWGVKNFKFQETVQNRAIRLFLGVSKYTTNVAIQGDMGWPSVSSKIRASVFRLWNRLINMSNSRLTKKIFLNDITVKKCTWSSQVLKILRDLYGKESQLGDFLGGVNLPEVKLLLTQKDSENWKKDVENFPKLRTYRTLKSQFGKENYVDNFLSKNRRSLLAQIRTGTSFLRIETGRYERQIAANGQFEKLPVEKRICRLCDKNEIEDEFHFVMKCNQYTQARAILRHNLEKIGGVYEETTENLAHLLSEKRFLGITADFLQYALEIRKTLENK